MKLFKTYKTFDEISSLYLTGKEISLKHRTYINHRGKINLFSLWLKENNFSEFPIRKITSQTISDFFIYLAKIKDLDRSTVDKYFLVLRSVFIFAKQHEQTDIIPFEFVTLPQKKKDMGAEIISSTHLRILLPEIQKRDSQLYLACMIQYYCFIRPGTELRLMKIGDIDLTTGTIQVNTDHAKNGHKRIVTMPKQLIAICRSYGIDRKDKSLYVFGKHKMIGEDRPVSVNMLSWRFDKIRDSLNFPKGYKLYSFKHTGATALHNSNTVSLRGLMDQLGHSKLDATQHYIKKHAGFVNEKIKDFFPDPIPQPQFIRIR